MNITIAQTTTPFCPLYLCSAQMFFFRHPERSGLTLSQADEEKEEKADEKEETEDCDGSYPLVNLQKTTENHNFL